MLRGRRENKAPPLAVCRVTVTRYANTCFAAHEDHDEATDDEGEYDEEEEDGDDIPERRSPIANNDWTHEMWTVENAICPVFRERGAPFNPPKCACPDFHFPNRSVSIHPSMSSHQRNITTLTTPVGLYTASDAFITRAAFGRGDAIHRASVRVSPHVLDSLLSLPLVLDVRTSNMIDSMNAVNVRGAKESTDKGQLGLEALRFLNERSYFPRLLSPFQPSHCLPHYSHSNDRDVCIILCSGTHIDASNQQPLLSWVASTKKWAHSCACSVDEDFVARSSPSTPLYPRYTPHSRVIWMTRRTKLALIAHLFFDAHVNRLLTSMESRIARAKAPSKACRIPVGLWQWMDVFVDRPQWAESLVTQNSIYAMRVYTPLVEYQRLHRAAFPLFAFSPPQLQTLFVLFLAVCCNDAISRIYVDVHASATTDEGSDVYFGLLHLLFHSVVAAMTPSSKCPSLESLQLLAASDTRPVIQHAARQQLQRRQNMLVDYLCDGNISGLDAFMLFESLPTYDTLLLLTSVTPAPLPSHDSLSSYSCVRLHPSQVEEEVGFRRFDLVSLHKMRCMARSTTHPCVFGFPTSLLNPFSSQHPLRPNELSSADQARLSLIRVDGPAPWFLRHSLVSFFQHWHPMLRSLYGISNQRPAEDVVVVAPLSETASIVCSTREEWEFFLCMRAAQTIQSSSSVDSILFGYSNVTNLLLFHCVGHNPLTPNDQVGSIQLHVIWKLIAIVAELTSSALPVGDDSIEAAKVVLAILSAFAHNHWVLPLHCLKVMIHFSATWVVQGQSKQYVEARTAFLHSVLQEHGDAAQAFVDSISSTSTGEAESEIEDGMQASVYGSKQDILDGYEIEQIHHIPILRCLAAFCSPGAPRSSRDKVVGVLERIDIHLDIPFDVYERQFLTSPTEPLDDWWPRAAASESIAVVTNPPPTDDKDIVMERQALSAIWLVLYFCGQCPDGDQVVLNRSRVFREGERRRDDMLGSSLSLVPFMDVLKMRSSFPCIGHRASDNGRVSLIDAIFIPSSVNVGDGVSSLQRWFLHEMDAVPPALMAPFQARVQFLHQMERSKAHPVGQSRTTSDDDNPFSLNSPIDTSEEEASPSPAVVGVSEKRHTEQTIEGALIDTQQSASKRLKV